MKRLKRNVEAETIMWVIGQKRREMRKLPVRVMLRSKRRLDRIICLAQRYNNLVFA